MNLLVTPEEPSTPRVNATSLAIALIASLAIAAVSAAIAVWAKAQLPANAQIPTHWNSAGIADRYSGPWALFRFPAFIAGVSVLFYFIPRWEPRHDHLSHSTRAYCWIWLTTVLFLAALNLLVVWTALGHPVSMDRWLSGGLGLLFIVMGNFLGKIRSNFMFGIRVPWTLSSDLSWNKTHRLAGRLLLIGGVAQIVSIAAGFRGKPLVFLLLGWLGLTIIIAMIYSYRVWRSDPDRRTS